MYTLQKAKQDIDAVAKHATDIAVHSIGVAAEVEAKLEVFKKDILSAIDEKFAELSRSIRGDEEAAESTAISDLGAKVSLLTHPAAPGETEHAGENDHSGQSEHGHQDDVPSQDNNWNHDQHNEHHQHD